MNSVCEKVLGYSLTSGIFIQSPVTVVISHIVATSTQEIALQVASDS